MNNKIKFKMSKAIEGLIYILFVLLGYYMAFLIKFNLSPDIRNLKPFYNSIPFIIIISILVFIVYDVLSTVRKTKYENFIIIFLSMILINILTITYAFITRGFSFPRSVFVIGFILQVIFIFTTKLIVLKILRNRYSKPSILVIGNSEEASYVSEKIVNDGITYSNIETKAFTNIEYISKSIDLADRVYLGSEIYEEVKTEVIQYCVLTHKVVYLVPSIYEISLINADLTQVSDLLLLRVDGLGLSRDEEAIKRLMDVVISAVGIIITFPIMLITGILIKLSDGGPVLFKQDRVTKDNRTFKLYKFRTMIINAEKNTGAVLAKENDERITPIGKFLRATRIDELPQFVNVIMGDMSIVGPRPERPTFVKQYCKEIKEFSYRTNVKAGITGLAQVMGRYTTSPQDKARYDILYIKDYSVALDIKILLNTIRVMFIKESTL